MTKMGAGEMSQLDKASSYSQIPEPLKTLFRVEGVHLSPDATVIKSLKEPRWFIVDSSSGFLNIFHIEIVASSSQIFQLDVTRETPTYSDNIHDYPIYRVGIAFKGDEALYISGREREELTDERQLQKWDYFFRASKEELGNKHYRLAGEFEEWRSDYQALLNKNAIKAGVLFVVSLFLLIKLWWFVALPIIAYGLYRFRNWFIDLYQSYKNTRFLKFCDQKLGDELQYLESQVFQQTVSEDQVRKWLEEEVRELDQKTVAELGLSPDHIIRREFGGPNGGVDINKDILGLKIQEWGITQPLSANGKKSIEKKHWHHLRALRRGTREPLVGVYYIHFIYLTPDNIGISSFFYDFILAKRFGTMTTQYFYRDIVGLGTAVKDTLILTDLEELETKQIILSFVNNEKICIALTDQVAIENLGSQIERRESQLNSGAGGWSGLDNPFNPEMDQLKEVGDEFLPATRSNFVLTNLKTYWNEKKNPGLPPSNLLS